MRAPRRQTPSRTFGKVDVLVNNAGTNPYFGPLLNAERRAWDKTFEVNLKGYFWCAREVARHCVGREAPGARSSTSPASPASSRPPMQGVYAMTKAAVISMTKTLALELGPSKIRVNAIAPGFVDTRLASAILKNDELVEARRRSHPDAAATARPTRSPAAHCTLPATPQVS